MENELIMITMGLMHIETMNNAGVLDLSAASDS